MEEEIKLYSVISALVEVDNELIFQNGYGYKTELRSYTHYNSFFWNHFAISKQKLLIIEVFFYKI